MLSNNIHIKTYTVINKNKTHYQLKKITPENSEWVEYRQRSHFFTLIITILYLSL